MAHKITERAPVGREATVPARRRGWVRRWLLVALAAALVVGTTMLAYRALEIRAGSPTIGSDGSSLFVEVQRMEQLAPASLRVDGSAELAEELRMSRFAPPPSTDRSSEFAEYRRQLGLASVGLASGGSGGAGDGSSEAAEHHRLLNLAPSSLNDGSWEVAESGMMSQLALRD